MGRRRILGLHKVLGRSGPLGPHRVLGLHRFVSPHKVLGSPWVLGTHRGMSPGFSQGSGSRFSDMPVEVCTKNGKSGYLQPLLSPP